MHSKAFAVKMVANYYCPVFLMPNSTPVTTIVFIAAMITMDDSEFGPGQLMDHQEATNNDNAQSMEHSANTKSSQH